MDPMKIQLYNVQRDMVLMAKADLKTKNSIPSHYAFAWYAGIYPIFDESDCHKELAELFSVKKNEVEAVITYFEEQQKAAARPTFFQFEEGLKKQFELKRSSLIKVLRYIYLRHDSEPDFWESLLTKGQYPPPAKLIIEEFDMKEWSRGRTQSQ